jgi:hypothetical protein
MKNKISIILYIIYFGFNLFLWLNQSPESSYFWYNAIFITIIIISVLSGGLGIISLSAINKKEYLSRLKIWTIAILFISFGYSAFTFSYCENELPSGSLVEKDGQFYANNHGDYQGPYTKAEFYKLKRYRDLSLLAGVGFFLSLGLSIFNVDKK